MADQQPEVPQQQPGDFQQQPAQQPDQQPDGPQQPAAQQPWAGPQPVDQQQWQAQQPVQAPAGWQQPYPPYYPAGQQPVGYPSAGYPVWYGPQPGSYPSSPAYPPYQGYPAYPPYPPSAPVAPVAPAAPAQQPGAGHGQPAPGSPAAEAGAQPAPAQPAPTSDGDPAGRQTPTPDPVAPRREHVHHSFVWLSCLRVVIVAVIVCAFSVLQAMAEGVLLGSGEMVGEELFVVAVTLVVCALFVFAMLAYYAVAWRYLTYELGSEEFTVYSGILVKKRNHVPYRRIQSIDQRASLLQRLFGVCTVSIDTAGGAANSTLEVPYLTKDQAEELRRELFARKLGADAPQATPVAPVASAAQAPAGWPGAPAVAPQSPRPSARGGNVLDAPAEIWDDVRGVFAGQTVDTGRVTYEYGLTNGELVLTGISGSGGGAGFAVLVLGVLAVVVELFSDVVIAMSDAQLDGAIDAAAGLGSLLIVGTVVALVVLFLVLRVVSAIGTCISFGGFRARRRADRIEVEYGLLQHRIQGVDIDRVQYLRVKQGFIRRLMGYCELSVGKVNALSQAETSGLEVAETSDLVIHPFVKVERVPEIVNGIIPEFAGMPAPMRPLAPVALRRGIVRRAVLHGVGFWIAVGLALLQIFLNVFLTAEGGAEVLPALNAGFVVGYVLCVVIAAVEVAGSVLWFRGSGYAFDERFVQVRNAGYAVETVGMPRAKLQFACTRTNPLQRHAGTATIQARSAAGVGGTTVQLIDLTRQEAEEFLDWVRPRGARGAAPESR